MYALVTWRTSGNELTEAIDTGVYVPRWAIQLYGATDFNAQARIVQARPHATGALGPTPLESTW